MSELTVIFWRDIPAQVTVGSGRSASRAILGERFQEAIDAAAMAAGLFGTDDYLEEWRRESRPCTDPPDEAVVAEAARLEETYDDDALARLVRQRGQENS